MVLEAASHLVAKRITSSNFLRYAVPLAAGGVLRSWSAGYICNEDRNLHDKTYILVGAFSGPGLALFRSLALRGAQIIALHPDPSSPPILQLILLLRSTTSNERIYADECDVRSYASLRNFVKRWEKDGRTGMVQDLEARIDGVVFCDGGGIGMEGTGYRVPQQLLPNLSDDDPLDLFHSSLLLSRHALIQLLLPTLLRSASTSSTPIRIISQISPFYSTSPTLSLTNLDYTGMPPFPSTSPWLAEGQSSLASIVLLRELQLRVQHKNLLIISVCGGVTRAWVYRTLRANREHPRFSWIGWALSWLIWPVVWYLTKSAEEASQGLLAAVLAGVQGGEAPVVVGEEGAAEVKTDGRADEVGDAKVNQTCQNGRKKIKLRGGAVYREGVEVRIPALERASSTLGAELWELESKRVEKLVSLAVVEEKEKEKEEEKLKREKASGRAEDISPTPDGDDS